MMSDPVMNSETEDKIVMDHALEVLQTQLRELQTNYDTLMQAHTSQRATAVDTVWRYLPQHSTDFRQIPALDPNMRETETCAGNYSFGQVLGHGKYCTVRKCARMIAVAPTSSSNSSAQTQQQQRPPGRLAVKIFRKEDVLAASQLLKIERELCVLSAISKSNGHCNVIEFVDCLHARNCLYVVLEACPMDLVR
jgi:serine/threonine protein kinase